MAVSNKFTQKSLFGGGSTKSNTLKIDTSYGANLGGRQQSNVVNLPTLSSGGNSGGLMLAAKSLGIKKFPSRAVDRIFSSKMSDKDRKELVSRWSHAVQRTLGRF